MSQDKNLYSLKAEFRDKGKAARGYGHIIKFIEANQHEQLAHLLRNHEQETVYSDELVKRFEIDTLVEFYNIILIAALAGYIDPRLDKEMQEEIKFILSQPSLKQYYINYYPYKLTEYTFAYVRFEKYFEQKSNEFSLSAFNSFISLSRMLKKDQDLEHFVNMLDHVSYGEESINEVNEILSDSDKLRETILSKEKTIDQTAVMGFFKYSAFMSQLKEILQSLDDFPLLQSAMWLYHGYYFDRMNIKMKKLFDVAFKNIEHALSSPQTFNNIARDVYGENVPDDFDEEELKQYANVIVDTAKNDVEYILDPKWGEPMREYFRGSL